MTNESQPLLVSLPVGRNCGIKKGLTTSRSDTNKSSKKGWRRNRGTEESSRKDKLLKPREVDGFEASMVKNALFKSKSGRTTVPSYGGRVQIACKKRQTVYRQYLDSSLFEQYISW